MKKDLSSQPEFSTAAAIGRPPVAPGLYLLEEEAASLSVGVHRDVEDPVAIRSAMDTSEKYGKPVIVIFADGKKMDVRSTDNPVDLAISRAAQQRKSHEIAEGVSTPSFASFPFFADFKAAAPPRNPAGR